MIKSVSYSSHNICKAAKQFSSSEKVIVFVSVSVGNSPKTHLPGKTRLIFSIKIVANNSRSAVNVSP